MQHAAKVQQKESNLFQWIYQLFKLAKAYRPKPRPKNRPQLLIIFHFYLTS